MNYGRQIRDKWYLKDDVYYLNHGSFGATPKEVIQAMMKYHEKLELEPVTFFLEEMPVLLRSAASKLGDVIGANGNDLVFVDNATSGVNTVLRSLLPEIKPGDELLTTNHVYPAVRNALLYVAELSGAKVIEANIPFPVDSNEQIINIIKENINERTKLAVIDHVTSSTALIFPIKEIIEILRKNNTYIIIDGAHAPGMLDLNIEDLKPDFYTGNCHKWLFAPKSCAFLWTSPEMQKKIHPLVISLEYGQGYLPEFDWVGTRDPAAWLSVVDAIDFYNKNGSIEIRKYNNKLAIEARKIVAESIGEKPASPDYMIGSMASFVFPGNITPTKEINLEFRKELLDDFNIEVPFFNLDGRLLFRISAQIYNELNDYEYFCKCIIELINKKLRKF